MRSRLLVMLLFASCAGDRVFLADGTRAHVRRDFCCTERDDAPMNVAEACTAKAGCSYGAGLICRGVETPPEIELEEREARESCRLACACTCADDHEACARVP